MCDHSMWALYVSTLCQTTLCEHSMCGHSMCDHSMWALYMWPLYVSTLCVTTLWEHSMCGHSMWALYVGPFYVSTLCVTTLCEHSMCDHSMGALYVWPLYVSISSWAWCCRTPDKYENYHEKWTSVLGPDVAEHPKVRKLPRKMNISSWAGCCRTPKSTKITRKHRLQFLGRMLQRQKRQKSPGFIVKTPVKSIGEHRKVRELPRKMNMEEVEEPKKYENLQTKPVLDPFKSTADTRKVRELPRKMNIEEVEEPETMKIYRQNPRASARPPRKLRKFTDETNMQARNHENSDEFRPTPLRHLDLDTPSFYYYRKNPKCYHTVWGNISFFDKVSYMSGGAGFLNHQQYHIDDFMTSNLIPLRCYWYSRASKGTKKKLMTAMGSFDVLPDATEILHKPLESRKSLWIMGFLPDISWPLVAPVSLFKLPCTAKKQHWLFHENLLLSGKNTWVFGWMPSSFFLTLAIPFLIPPLFWLFLWCFF